ncbi:MAG: hypothetical protein K2X60_13370 [Xanthobacteraceae bacterium]|nr:hypothetical protein [Xanthobacteraceae bacterium]
MCDRQQDTSVRRQRVVRALLVLSPFLFVFCLVLAGIQGADLRASLIIAFAGLAMCLGAAGFYAVRGAQSTEDLFWFSIILRLFR